MITTVRVVGVPQSSTDAEFNCWFMCAYGFEQATLGPPQQNGGRSGWARFSSGEAAQAVITALNGRQLSAEQSPEQPVLSAEFAKKNFKASSNLAKRQRSTYDAPSHAVPPPSGMAASPYSAVVMPPPAAVRPASPRGDSGSCSTLYIRDLDASATEEELYYCLHGFAGFERLKFTPPSQGKTGMCWAKFGSPQEAHSALQELSASALPSNPTTALQVQLAKNDLDEPSRKRDFDGMGGGVGPASPSPFVQKIAAALQNTSRAPSPAPAAYSAGGGGGGGGGAAGWGGARGNPPCDTMFVGNLAPSVTEYELLGVLHMLPGFTRVKFVGEGTPKPMAFAQFESIDSCMQAVQSFDGSSVASAPQQAIRCSFSKNSLDRPTPKY